MQVQSGKHNSGETSGRRRGPGGGPPRHLLARLPDLLLTLPMLLTLLMLLLQPASAAEFGEVNVSSYIGQPLVAEVELLALTPEEQGALQVKPANLDVYRGANIKYQPVISGLRWVVQRRGQRQFIRLSTERPVRTPFLNLFLELGVKGDMSVRALTLWLEADPETVASAQSRLQEAQETDEAVSPAATVATERAADQFELPATQRPQCTGGERCAAVDRQNRRITRQITELEKNVGALRKVIVGAASIPASAKAQPVSPPSVDQSAAEIPAPEAASADTELFLKKEEPIIPKKPVPKQTPWKLIAMIAAGVLALLLAGLLLYKRSRRGKKPASKNKPEKTPSWWSKLREKWRKRKPAPPTGAADDGDADTPDAVAGHDEATVPDDGKKTGRLKAMLATLGQRWQALASRMKQVFARGKKKPAPEAVPAVEGEG